MEWGGVGGEVRGMRWGRKEVGLGQGGVGWGGKQWEGRSREGWGMVGRGWGGKGSSLGDNPQIDMQLKNFLVH